MLTIISNHDIFIGLEHLKTLKLNNNIFTKLQNRYFDLLVILNFLDISSNEIGSIERNAF
jgi:hypothetical protein